MRTERQLSHVGGLLAVLGVLIVALTGTIAFHITPGLMHPGIEKYGLIFAGTRAQGMLCLVLSGLVTLFGVNTLTGGIRQIRTRRKQRDTWTVGIAAVIVVVLIVFFGTISGTFAHVRAWHPQPTHTHAISTVMPG